VRCADPGQAEGQPLLGPDRHDQFVECDRHSPAGGLVNHQLVVSAPKALHGGVSGDGHPGTAVLFEAVHRTQPRLQRPVSHSTQFLAYRCMAEPPAAKQIHRRDVLGGLVHEYERAA
jgi:hypothetical protein